MKKFYCDKCKSEKPDGKLTSVKLTVGYIGGYYSNGDYADIDLCGDCLKSLGINVTNDGYTKIQEKNDSEKLYELIQNIVSDCISNQ